MTTKFVKRVARESFYRVYLSILNGILKLTDKEIEILAEFMAIKEIDDASKKFISEKERNELLFSGGNRKLIRTKIGTSPHNLNNYIKTLKEKGALIEKDGTLAINPKIYIPSVQNKNSIVFDLETYDSE